ncbi:hypothetical protein JTE90_029554 [Oedothorax gibbosus]|uniref:RING-type domain-containing protein n=1 Tax=Oedothorax gibbosus TaxID=931172 RepID=A0AAV6VD58_9ARAC|nr:hypothetical protein JTE90_029554 [Oedothorax gibbosus]
MDEVDSEVGLSPVEKEGSSTKTVLPFNINPESDEKYNLNLKLRNILSCVVCKELRRSSIYQCKYGHLICAGCFGDVLSESKIQNEIATCPQCQSTISKESCSQNIAVEKAILELPRTCHFCCLHVPPETYQHHQTMTCLKRPAICSNNSIGCSWKGSFFEKPQHEEQCAQQLASGEKILSCLIAMDEQVQKELTLCDQVFQLLSSETLLYFDLQFKYIETKEKRKFFESSKFYVFHNSFVLHGYFQEENSQFTYRIVSKNDYINKSLNFTYVLLKGPYSDMEIKPQLCHFACKESQTFYTLDLWYNTQGLKTYFSAERVNFRIFIFK